MPIEYVNRVGKTYYLHRGRTKTGKAKYYFSLKTEGDLVETMPDGYEIYEEPCRAQVFLRRVVRRLITDGEKTLVETAVARIKDSRRYLVGIKGKTVTIYQSDQELDRLRAGFAGMSLSASPSRLEESLIELLTYGPVMRFTLLDKNHRVFLPERYCFMGSVDDWIVIGASDKLDRLVEKFVGTIGTEAFYELY